MVSQSLIVVIWGPEAQCATDNIGAILSVADWLSRTLISRNEQPLTMDTVLIALIKAYEIQGCFQTRNAFNKVGLDHTLLVKIASTAVVSWLLGLSEIQTLDALSQAWMDGAPLRVYRQSPNAGPRKGWAAGDACMRAIHLALLTKHGQPGAPTVLTAPKWGFYDTLFEGKAFQLPTSYGSTVIENIFFKIHAVEGHAATAVEAALEVSQILRQRSISIEKDVEHIRVRTQEAAMIIINKQGALHNPADRDHCMQYIIAVILLKGSMIEAKDYQDDSIWAQDPRVEDLRKRITMEETKQFTLDYHDKNKASASNALQVYLRGGQILNEVLVEYPVGHPWRSDTLGLVRTKFEKNVREWFGGQKNEEEILRLASLTEDDFRKVGVCDLVDAFAATDRGSCQRSAATTEYTVLMQRQSTLGNKGETISPNGSLRRCRWWSWLWRRGKR